MVSLANLLYTVFITMTDVDKSNEMSIEKSSYLMVSQELGRGRYFDLRNTLMSEGCNAAPWYKVNSHCNSITPERISVTLREEVGVVGYRFKFKDVCTYIVSRSLLAAQVTGATVPANLYIGGKYGTDGSGGHYRERQYIAI